MGAHLGFGRRDDFHRVTQRLDGGDDSDDGDAESAEDQPEIKLGDLEALQGVVKFPVRIKCATLSWNTLSQGLDELESAEA